MLDKFVKPSNCCSRSIGLNPGSDQSNNWESILSFQFELGVAGVRALVLLIENCSLTNFSLFMSTCAVSPVRRRAS